jgi:hypothetical protein
MSEIFIEGAEGLEGFFAALRNLDRTEREEFREIIKAQFRPTLRERYLTVNYHRAAFNVEMLLKITDTKQFQASSLLTQRCRTMSADGRARVAAAQRARWAKARGG